MTAIYALPDHQVVLALVPRIGRTRLSNEQAVARIRAVPGMVPLAIDHGGNGQEPRVLWGDIGDYPFREWQYMFTVEALAKQDAIGERFSTALDILLDDRIAVDSLEPAGFMFHISRCGSTLTGKALARSPRHLVINQGGPLQRGFWAAITGDFTRGIEASAENLAMFRNLVLAMTRRRLPEQRLAFVKFISWNTLYIDFAMQAFPQVPALFLYRDPVEVIASVLKETSAVLWAKGRPQSGLLADTDWRDTQAMGEVEYLARCFANYLTVAEASARPVAHVNYRDINPASFPVMLARGLDFDPGADELALMLEQFRFHSKDDSDSKAFTADSAAKQDAIAEADKALVARFCSQPLARLDASPANLFPRSDRG